MSSSSEIVTVDFTPDSLMLKTAFDAPLELNNTGDRVKLIVDLGGVIANNVADLVKCRPDAVVFDITIAGKTPYGAYIDASFWLCLAPNNNLVAGDVLTVSAKAVADDTLTASLDFTIV